MPSEKRVLIASDHAGLTLKAELRKRFQDWDWLDLGPQSAQSVDYPDYAELVARKIASGEYSQGILICGSGIGMSIAANKIAGIRAALVENPSSARLSKEHNNANILCLGARFLAPEYAEEIVRVWLETPFSSEAKHAKRISKIQALEAK